MSKAVYTDELRYVVKTHMSWAAIRHTYGCMRRKSRAVIADDNTLEGL